MRRLAFCAVLTCLAATPFTLSQTSQTQLSPAQVERAAAGDTAENPGPLATDLRTDLKPADIEKAMRKVADWQIATAEDRFNQQWTFAPLYDGLIATTQATGDPKYSAKVEQLASDRFHWKLIDVRFPHADDEAIGQAYLDLYRSNPSPEKIAHVKDITDRLVVRPDDPNKPLWWWCDALFMAPSVLARMSAISGDPKYLNTMDHEWWITSGLLYNQSEHLYWRDATYLKKTEKNGKPLFWARGNGWVLAGLADVLRFMPADYPSRAKYVQQFQDMARKIASLQQPDGLWKTGLLDQQDYELSEISGTAFFTYGMAWGINQGLLNKAEYQPVVGRAWAGMVRHIYADGRLGSIQPIGAAPDKFSPGSSYVYGVGGFLIAGNQLHQLGSHGKAVHAKSAKPGKTKPE